VRKTTSLKQIAANRRNALKSTGPKTPEGCAVSKMNALKHGISSKAILVRGLQIKENSRELEALYQSFWQEFKPVGPVEEMLVDQIVTAQWRLRRALRAESGEIALSLRRGPPNRPHRPNPQLQWVEWLAFGDPIPKMEDSAEGNRVLKILLEEVRTSVELHGELTEAALQKLANCFGGEQNSLTRSLEALRLELQENPRGLGAAELRERNKRRALALLDEKLRSIFLRQADEAKWQTSYQKWQTNVEDARREAAVLPAPEVLDKIMRYETKLERQIYRAMSQLERKQRMRKGEAVLAPMTIEVLEGA
jgi:hypothetical protein